MGEYKKAALCSAYKNKTPRPISREWKKERNLFRRADDDEEEREENDIREKARIRSVLLVILTIIILFCVCVCVRACLKDEEENSQRATFERWRERERC